MMPADVLPACADDLPLVDAAFERGKAANQAARELARLCRSCSCADSCLAGALAGKEHGVWAGTRRPKSNGGGLGPARVVAL